MARILIRKLERKRSLETPRHRWAHRNKSVPGQTTVIIFERTQINPPSLVLLRRKPRNSATFVDHEITLRCLQE
jgi:hypothetical protein